MTLLDAYELTLEKITELKKNEIRVIITPSNSNSVRKCNELLFEKWVRVSFKNLNEQQRVRVCDAANYLGMCGIAFDVGGCCGSRDWELDWSFRYTGEENMEWIIKREEMENIIENECKIL